MTERRHEEETRHKARECQARVSSERVPSEASQRQHCQNREHDDFAKAEDTTACDEINAGSAVNERQRE